MELVREYDMLKVTTETGAVYTIDLVNKFWRKNKGSFERLRSLMVGTALTEPWEDEEHWVDADAPEVGKHLYIACKDFWYVSTVVVSVEEIRQP